MHPIVAPSLELRGHIDSVSSVVFHPTDPVVVSGSHGIDCSVRFWHSETGQLLHTLTRTDGWAHAAFDPVGAVVAIARGVGAVELLAYPNQSMLATLPICADHGILRVQFSSDSQYVIAESDRETIHVWDWRGAREILRLDDVYPSGASNVGVGRWSSLLVYPRRDGSLVVLDFLQPTQPRVLQTGDANQFTLLAAHDTEVVALDRRGLLSRWNWRTGELLATSDLDDRVSECPLFLSDDERLIATEVSAGKGRWAVVVRSDLQSELSRFSGMVGPIWCLAFNRRGDRLAVGSDDKLIRIWDLTQPGATASPTP